MGEPIIQRIVARIEEERVTEGHETCFAVFYDGNAGPHVSSGSQFGGCFGAKTREEAVKEMKVFAKNHADWLVSYHNPETDEVFKTDRKVVTKLIIDGVDHDVNESGDLLSFINS